MKHMSPKPHPSVSLSSQHPIPNLTPLGCFIAEKGRHLFKEHQNVLQEMASNYSTYDTKQESTDTSSLNKKKAPHKADLRAKKKFAETGSYSSDSSREVRKSYQSDTDLIIYPSKKDFGLSSSEDEKITNIDASLRDDLANEIEMNIVGIYNKNISVTRKRKLRLNKREQDLKQAFKQLADKYHTVALQILSETIKELIEKYKEKIFEIPELALMRVKFIEDKYQFNDDELNLSQVIKVALTLYKFPNDLSKYGIANVLLRELVNIKQTLQRSSNEIKNIFQAPLNIIEQVANVKFNIEQMQIEEFSKVMLNDEVIAWLLRQLRIIFTQSKSNEIINLINSVEEDKGIGKTEIIKFNNVVYGKVSLIAIREVKEKEKQKEKAKAQALENALSEKERQKTLALTLSPKEGVKKEDNAALDLDELVKFIDSEKGRKRGKKKKHNKQKDAIKTANAPNGKENESKGMNDDIPPQALSDENELNDTEIDELKKKWKTETKDSHLYQKIRTVFSQTWLKAISNY